MKNKMIALALTLCSLSAMAEQYKMIIPFPPGGFTDHYARIIQNEAKKRGDDITIVYKLGADGLVGLNELLNDSSYNTFGVVPFVLIQKAKENDKLKMDILSLTAISNFGFPPLVVFTNKKTEIKTVDELKTKLNIKNLNFGTSTSYIAEVTKDVFYKFNNLNVVSYNGDKQLIVDVMNGSVDIGVGSYANVKELIKSGDVIPLATIFNRVNGINQVLKTNKPIAIHGFFMKPNTSKEKSEKVKLLLNDVLISEEIKIYENEYGIPKPKITIEEVLEENLK